MERKGGEDLIVSFCGHANILDTLSTKEKLFKALLSIKCVDADFHNGLGIISYNKIC